MKQAINPLAYPLVRPKSGPPSGVDNSTRGVVYGLAAVFLLAIMSACSKILSAEHSVIEIAFYRNIVAVIPLLIFIAAKGRTGLLKTGKPALLLLRVVVGSIGLVTTLAAFAHLPMADATLIILTSVLITPALAFFFLDERFGIHRWGAILLGLAGVALMVHPSGEIETLGVIIAFTAAFLQSIIQIFLRRLRTESSFTVTFYFILGGCILPGLCMPFVAKALDMQDFLLMLCVGASGGCAQYLLTSAYRAAPTYIVTPLNYTGLVWAGLLDVVIWAHRPDITVFVGGFIIIASQAYIIYRERRARAVLPG